ncbi:hypothetical protein [uncultured Algibacter sp.]|uniref:hypothetical protein n=1 Tax=uncultured Algibacter sp. TaxID=298659 RepID=UPI00260D4430|nr:hypothetical protein [uncultured Algibacter sp.]
MDKNKNIQSKIDSTLSAMDTIETVSVSPFFKDKTMQRLFAEKEEASTVWNWFTPKLQLATLVCVVVLNVIAFTKLDDSSSYDENVSEFAESYGLSIYNDETSILN